MSFGENEICIRDEVLIRAYPKSGRTHQIRLHCQYLGLPIRGDVKYGGVCNWKGIDCDFHALHAESLSFKHPIIELFSAVCKSCLGILLVRDSSQIASIRYGTGSISGFFSEEQVTIGDLIVNDQALIEGTKEPNVTFLVVKFDGILGLGFQEISVENATPLCWLN